MSRPRTRRTFSTETSSAFQLTRPLRCAKPPPAGLIQRLPGGIRNLWKPRAFLRSRMRGSHPIFIVTKCPADTTSFSSQLAVVPPNLADDAVPAEGAARREDDAAFHRLEVSLAGSRPDEAKLAGGRRGGGSEGARVVGVECPHFLQHG